MGCMSLFRKMFGDKQGTASPSRPPEAPDSIDSDTQSSRTASRRDVVHVVLRDTMRKHGIPSDWIECRTLSMVQTNKSTGTYVTLIVRGGQDRLLSFVPAFQASLRRELERFDPRVADWLRGLAWQFEDEGESPAAMPDPAIWQSPTPGLEVRESLDGDEDGLQRDLQALFAIRDAAIAGSRDPAADFQPTQTGR